MGNKLEQLKRGHSRERLANTSSLLLDQSLSNSSCSLNGSPFAPAVSRSPSSAESSTLNVETAAQLLSTQTVNRRTKTCRRPPAANGGIVQQQRRSSTGASITSKFLFRSSSTSQLSSAYYRCDDPSEDLNAQDITGRLSKSPKIPASACSTPSSGRAYMEAGNVGYLPTKTVSCENIPIAASSLQAALQKAKASAGATSPVQPDPEVFANNCGCPTSAPTGRKPSFPYAFLRSRLTSLPEENQQSQRGCAEVATPIPVSVPYDVNQIKAKMHQMYTETTGGMTNKSRSSSTCCVFRENLTAPAYQHPPSHYGSSLLAPARQSSADADADSGIEKEASSDSSSLYGSDVSGGNSWELSRSGDRSPPAEANSSRNPLVSFGSPKSEMQMQYNNHNGPDSLPSVPAPPAASLLSTHHRSPEANGQTTGNVTTNHHNNNNNKWDYREVKHRMRSRASSLDSVKLGESRKWSVPSSGQQRKSISEVVEAKNSSIQNNQQQQQPPPCKSNEKKLTSFLRGHVRSVSFGRGALTLPGRKSSKINKEPAANNSSIPTVQFQIGHSTRYIPARESDQVEAPTSLPSIQLPSTKQYRLLRLIKDESGELGILITLKRGSDGSMQGYVIGHVEPGGVADRYSSLNLSSRLSLYSSSFLSCCGKIMIKWNVVWTGRPGNFS